MWPDRRLQQAGARAAEVGRDWLAAMMALPLQLARV
jgi:hypothetical protein